MAVTERYLSSKLTDTLATALVRSFDSEVDSTPWFEAGPSRGSAPAEALRPTTTTAPVKIALKDALRRFDVDTGCSFDGWLWDETPGPFNDVLPRTVVIVEPEAGSCQDFDHGA
jgi:hypothetical protein